jgi:hypothetical protein
MHAVHPFSFLPDLGSLRLNPKFLLAPDWRDCSYTTPTDLNRAKNSPMQKIYQTDAGRVTV